MSSQSITVAVAEKIATSAPVVRDRLVETLAEIELKSREQTLADGFKKVEAFKKDLRKTDRPDIVQLDRAGKQVGEGSFSKDRTQQIKKLEDDLVKWEAALSKAWGTPATADTAEVAGDFTKLRELLGKGGASSEA